MNDDGLGLVLCQGVSEALARRLLPQLIDPDGNARLAARTAVERNKTDNAATRLTTLCMRCRLLLEPGITRLIMRAERHGGAVRRRAFDSNGQKADVVLRHSEIRIHADANA